MGVLSIMPVDGQTVEKIYSAQIDTVQWLTYTDPEGRFSIQYPSFIKIVPKQNRFDTNDLSFSNENSSIIGYLVYELSSNDSNRLESLRKLVDAYNEILHNANALKQYRIIESNDTQINGNYAISQIVHTIDYEDTEKGTWEVFSYIYNKFFKFDYIAAPADFDKGLPTVQIMFNSIMFLK